MPAESDGVTQTELRAKLKQVLSRASDATLEELMESVSKPDTPPSDLLAERLLNEKCSPNEIHLALIYCRNALLMIQMQSPEYLGLQTVNKILLHYDRMTSFLMQATEKKHEQEWKSLQAELLKEGNAHLLERVIHHWSQKKQITLHNYFREMPVSVTTKLLHVGKEGFTIELNKSELAPLLSASSDGRSAYARLPDSELLIQLMAQEATRNTLRWGYGEFLPLTREKRRDVRVQSSTLTHINLTGPEQEEWYGSVMDISASGLGISFKCDIPFQVGNILTFSMILNGGQVAGKGIVCWVHGSKGHYRAGLTVERDQDSHLQLSNEILRRQKNLMGQLKLKGVPDCLISG
jgi:hypothetical protein